MKIYGISPNRADFTCRVNHADMNQLSCLCAFIRPPSNRAGMPRHWPTASVAADLKADHLQSPTSEGVGREGAFPCRPLYQRIRAAEFPRAQACPAMEYLETLRPMPSRMWRCCRSLKTDHLSLASG